MDKDSGYGAKMVQRPRKMSNAASLHSCELSWALGRQVPERTRYERSGSRGDERSYFPVGSYKVPH